MNTIIEQSVNVTPCNVNKNTTKVDYLSYYSTTYPRCPNNLLEFLADDLLSSAVPLDIAKENFRPVWDKKEIAEFLGWKGYKGEPGWIAGGQFKPIEPMIMSDKECKYLTPKGGYDAAALAGVDWAKILYNPSEPIVITEGAKKAASLIGMGYNAISLPGVDMGHLPGKRGEELVGNLKHLAVPGRPVILAFDSDITVKKEVQSALTALAGTLSKRGCVLSIWQWTVNDGKGIDDAIANGNFNNVTEINYNAWAKTLEKQFSNYENNVTQNKGKQKKHDGFFASQIAENYRDKIAWDSEASRWMMYGHKSDGMWSEVHSDYVDGLIINHLEAQGEPYGATKLKSVSTLLKVKLAVFEWENLPYLIPYRDGVFNLQTNQIEFHSPGYRLTWQLPYPYQGGASGWEKIDDWLGFATQGNQHHKNILIAFLAATLRGRADLQKFLHLQGQGGTGKSTFIRLLLDLIGKRNCHSTTIAEWSGNRFESANGYQKRLIVFPDEEKQVKNHGKFKSLTGQDPIRAEEKGKKAFSYQYDGMVIMASNQPVFVGGSLSAIARRSITVPFNATVPRGQRVDLNTQFKSELSAFSRYLLSVPNDWITETLNGDCHASSPVSLQEWENLCLTNSIAAWFDDCLILMPEWTERIGNRKAEPDKSQTDCEFLYQSYTLYCKHNGLNSVSSKRFSSDIIELLKDTMFFDVSKVSDRKGAYIQGVNLRKDKDYDKYPSYTQILERQNKLILPLGDDCGGLRGESVVDSVVDETLAVTDCGGCGGKTNTSIISTENQYSTVEQPSVSHDTQSIKIDMTATANSISHDKEIGKTYKAPNEEQVKLLDVFQQTKSDGGTMLMGHCKYLSDAKPCDVRLDMLMEDL